ncbi:MAG: hypothetical protein M1835_000260, partial [Candelina submexicana]
MASSHSSFSISTHPGFISKAIGSKEEEARIIALGRQQRPSDGPNEQKELEHGGIVGHMGNENESIRGRTRMAGHSKSLSRSGSRPQSTKSGRSSVRGADFFTGFSEDEEQQQRRASPGEEPSEDPEKTFEVHWDGDNDPMNPRSMPKGKKWLIVIIVSMSSTCV